MGVGVVVGVATIVVVTALVVASTSVIAEVTGTVLIAMVVAGLLALSVAELSDALLEPLRSVTGWPAVFTTIPSGPAPVIVSALSRPAAALCPATTSTLTLPPHLNPY